MISVIIPTYNRCDYLIQMVESILQQKHVDLEIVIVDDNSKDSTKEYCLDLASDNCQVKYFRNEANRGPGYSRNLGFNNSIGDYVVFADDDDYYTDFLFFSNALSIMQNNNEIALVSGNSKTLLVQKGIEQITPINLRGTINHIDYLSGFMIYYAKPNSTFTSVFRRSVLDQAGVSVMKMVNDAAIYMRALLYGDIYVLDDIIGVYRLHNNNITFNISSSFIIDNLEEKRHIFNESKRLKLFLPEDWLRLQYQLTIHYYYINNIYSIIDIFRICSWGLNNGCETYWSFIKKMIKYFLN